MSESLQIVCPHCDAINRVPAARLGESPRCGSLPHTRPSIGAIPKGKE